MPKDMGRWKMGDEEKHNLDTQERTTWWGKGVEVMWILTFHADPVKSQQGWHRYRTPWMEYINLVHLYHLLEVCRRCCHPPAQLSSSNGPGGLICKKDNCHNRKNLCRRTKRTGSRNYVLPCAGMGIEQPSICSSHTDHWLGNSTGDLRSTYLSVCFRKNC